ncbi:hypothetical protein [Pannonibacter tanglangensis]|uniref:Uncharacterized protein n=1 Tax=Pannonibacter tanglangensis TaxID=2750084 RepID=A0ABW9ZK77_9HYPH|nr:hypothetical protein [Pannonibacter sp. XCT-34]NBN64726.1 hypothetical protein [Pannonibacter sp. XCT-34]
MQLSIQSKTTTASLFAAQSGPLSGQLAGGALDAGATGKGAVDRGAQDRGALDRGAAPAAPAANILDLAAKKAEEDAVVIAALQEAVEKGKSEKTDEDDGSGKLATIEDYLQTADKIRGALGEDGASGASAAYESATITETVIEGEIGGQKISASFVSFDRVSYNSQTGLTSRSASAMTVEVSGNGVSSSYQSASVSSLYAGTDKQLGNLISGFA